MGHIEPVSGEDTLSRRKFIVTAVSAAGGLALGFAFPGLANARPLTGSPWSNDAVAANEINAWIVIDPDETITFRIPRWGRARPPRIRCWSPKNWNATGQRSKANLPRPIAMCARTMSIATRT